MESPQRQGTSIPQIAWQFLYWVLLLSVAVLLPIAIITMLIGSFVTVVVTIVVALIAILCVIALVTLLTSTVAVFTAGLVSLLKLIYLVREPSAIQKVGSIVKTPVTILRNESAGKEVILIGTIHMAEANYFSGISHYLDSLDQQGVPVLYEMVKPISEEEESKLTELQSNLYQQMKSSAEVMKKIAPRLLGLQYQLEGVPLKENWINTDMSLLELLGEMECQGVKSLPFNSKTVIKATPEDEAIIRYLINFVIGKMHLLEPLEMVFDYLRTAPMKKYYHIILHGRNEVALQGIRTQLQKHDRVVSMWGAAHIPGILEQLQSEGFVLTSKTWARAYQVKNLSLRKILKDFFDQRMEQKKGEKNKKEARPRTFKPAMQ
jgi:hypothetical protein